MLGLLLVILREVVVKLIKGKWNDNFLKQCGTFPNAKHDEHIDLTCYGIERNLMSKLGQYHIY